MWTSGGEHFVGGLECGPDGLLWAFNDFVVIHVDPKTGRQLPLSDKFLPRCYRSASFDQQGNVYLGEHMKAEKRPDNPIARRTTTKFAVIPGDGVLGFGYVYKYGPRLASAADLQDRDRAGDDGFQGGDPFQPASQRQIHHLCDGNRQAPDAL